MQAHVFVDIGACAASLADAHEWCVDLLLVHPAQIPIALEVYSPSAEDVAYKEAEARGLGAIQVDGEMIDAASVRILQNTLDRAEFD